MKHVRILSRSRRVVLALALILLLAAVSMAAASGGAPAGSGAARWAMILSSDGFTTDAVARSDDSYVVSFAKKGYVPTICGENGKQNYTPADVLFVFDITATDYCWFIWVDPALSGLGAKADINGIHDECAFTDPGCDIYLTFAAKTNVAGVGKVMPQDVVIGEWLPGSFNTYTNWELVFDGSDVGLTTNGEKIDAIYVFDPGEEPEDLGCLQLGLVSTAGKYSVPDQWGGTIEGGGEDVLGFCVYTDGWDTTGYWFLYHDGSAEGAPANSIVAITHQDGNKAYSRFEFLTKGPFKVDSAKGTYNNVFNFFGQTGEYSGPTFKFAEMGAMGTVDSFSVHHTEP